MDYHNTRDNTSWHKVGKWYNKSVGDSGHYFHQHVVLPGVIKLLGLKNNSSVLDLGCGQGVLARQLPKEIEYVGIDSAKSLITFAKDRDPKQNHHYYEGDVTRPLPISKKDFTHAAIILALQNLEKPDLALFQASDHLISNGKLVIVLNHPCFRIPRLTSWEIDEKKKLQYRRIERYLSPIRIPITAHPSKGNHSPITWSFHYPLSSYVQFLRQAGFVIEAM